jgi:integrase
MLKYLYRDVDRHGNERWYFRRRGYPKIRLTAIPGSPDFVDAFKAAMDRAAAITGPRTPEILHGSIAWLCAAYFASTEFKCLAGLTRKARRRNLEALCAEPWSPADSRPMGNFSFSGLKPAKIKELRDRKIETPEAANDRLKSMKALFSWACANGRASGNPAKEIAKFKTVSSGFHTWSPDEVLRFESTHPIGTKARLALALLLYTGQRKSDIAVMGRQHIRDGYLRFVQKKNSGRNPVAIVLPVLPVLQAIIDVTVTGNMTFLVTERGKPFTINGFGNKFREWCDQADLPHCSAHGVRKAGACLAAENGATEKQLMALFGWKTAAEAERYTRAADQKRLATIAANLLRR